MEISKKRRRQHDRTLVGATSCAHIVLLCRLLSPFFNAFLQILQTVRVCFDPGARDGLKLTYTCVTWLTKNVNNVNNGSQWGPKAFVRSRQLQMNPKA